MRKNIFYISLAVIVCLLTFSVNYPDYDLWVRLAVGSIFFQTGHILKHDIFSYLPTKPLWIDHEWGSGVVFYFFASRFGDWGIFALKAVILFAIFILIIKIVKLQNDEYSPGILYFMFIGFSLLTGVANLIRCQMFTYLFFTLWLYGLEKIKQGGNKLIWIFPATMLLWVNMHGGFLAGIGLVLIYAVGESLNRKESLKYLVVLGLIMPVTIMNPYGFDLWKYIIHAAFMPRTYISEWNPLSFSGPFHVVGGLKVHILAGFMIFVLLTLMAGFKLMLSKERYDWTRILLVIILLILGVRHQRHAMFFVLAVPGLLYHQYIDLIEPVKTFLKNKFTQTSLNILNGITYAFGYAVLVVTVLLAWPQLSGRIFVNPLIYPVGSMEFIKQNNISGNLATTYNWGSYALWKLYPQCRILIDGRYEEVYPDHIYDAAIQFSEKKGDWQAILKQYRPDVIVLSKANYFPSDLSALTDWQFVYEDAISAVLLPKDKMKPFFIHPDYHNPIYSTEDFSKHIQFNMP